MICIHDEDKLRNHEDEKATDRLLVLLQCCCPKHDVPGIDDVDLTPKMKEKVS